MKLSVRGRGREVFTPLTATERVLARINVSNRQGGRGPDRAPTRLPSGLASFRHLMRQRDIFLMATGRPPPS